MTALHWRTAIKRGRMAHAMPLGTTAALCGAEPMAGWSRTWWTEVQARAFLKLLCPACDRLSRKQGDQ